MEENQNPQTSPTSNFQGGSGVSFPSVNEPKRSGGPKTLLIVGILILVGVLGFVVYKSATTESEILPEPTPFDNLTAPSEFENDPTSTPAASVAPKAVDRENVAIQVQNGTGIAGEAAFLQTQLKNIGYTDVVAANASSQSATETTVTFAKDLDPAIVTEITQKLNSIYQTVSTKTATTATTYDVVIVTGLKKGATAQPAATATPSPATTGTASPSASPAQ
jgi:hypothetical protein